MNNIDLTKIPKSIVDLTRQATAEPIASFLGLIFLRMFGKSTAKLKAEAENEYDRTRQQGEIERRVQEPFIIQLETEKAYRQYSNLEHTILKAMPLITAHENRVANDNDVFWGFLEHSKEISNEQMQELIAKIIAGEYNTPNTYSMSTLQIIKTLGKSELELFERIGSLLVNDEQLPSELFKGEGQAKDLMLNMIKVHFGNLQELQSLGLFFVSDAVIQPIPNIKEGSFTVKYFDKELNFISDNENYQDVNLPSFFELSKAGDQIMKHLHPIYIEDYYLWLKENY